MKGLPIILLSCLFAAGMFSTTHAAPARFWVSTSNSNPVIGEAPVIDVQKDITRTLYIWAQPAADSTSGSFNKLIDFSLDIVALPGTGDPQSTPFVDFVDGSFKVYNDVVTAGKKRFEYKFDSQTTANFGGPLKSSTALPSPGVPDAIRGLQGFSIVRQNAVGIGDVNDPRHFLTNNNRDAWLIGEFSFQALKSSGSNDLYLQVGYLGMMQEGGGPTQVVFGDNDSPIYTASGTPAHWQTTLENDRFDVRINAIAPVLADYSDDGKVGPEDYWLWRKSFGGGSDLRADGNGDGDIDTADYVMWRNYQTVFTGDYNRNGAIRPDDYDFWRSAFGQTVSLPGLGADGNGDGIVDAADYVVWRKSLPLVQGDYDRDGVVGPQDFVYWKSSFGQTVAPGTGADGSSDGVIDAADYVVWRKHVAFGAGGELSNSMAHGQRSAVPEPASNMIGSICLFLTLRVRSIHSLRPPI